MAPLTRARSHAIRMSEAEEKVYLHTRDLLDLSPEIRLMIYTQLFPRTIKEQDREDQFHTVRQDGRFFLVDQRLPKLHFSYSPFPLDKAEKGYCYTTRLSSIGDEEKVQKIFPLKSLSFLETCRRIRAECFDFILSNNIFTVVAHPPDTFLRWRGMSNPIMQRILNNYRQRFAENFNLGLAFLYGSPLQSITHLDIVLDLDSGGDRVDWSALSKMVKLKELRVSATPWFNFNNHDLV